MSLWMESTKLFLLIGQVLCGLLVFVFFMKGKLAQKVFKGLSALFIVNQVAQLVNDAFILKSLGCGIFSFNSEGNTCETLESKYMQSLMIIDVLVILFLSFLLYLIHKIEIQNNEKKEKEALLPMYSA
jgi:hypothetical protein